MTVMLSKSTSWMVLMTSLRSFHAKRTVTGLRLIVYFNHLPKLGYSYSSCTTSLPFYSSTSSSSSPSSYYHSRSTSYSACIPPSSPTYCPPVPPKPSSSSSPLTPSRHIRRGTNIALKRRPRKLTLPPSFRLIDEEGENLGVMSAERATKLAESKNLKLVEVNKSNPSDNSEAIYKLFTGKQRYEEVKKRKKAAKSDPINTMKDLTVFTQIGEHDLAVKLSSLRDFLKRGHKARVFVKTKYRRGIDEKKEEENRREMVKSISTELEELGEKVSEARMQRRGIMCHFRPVKNDV